MNDKDDRLPDVYDICPDFDLIPPLEAARRLYSHLLNRIDDPRAWGPIVSKVRQLVAENGIPLSELSRYNSESAETVEAELRLTERLARDYTNIFAARKLYDQLRLSHGKGGDLDPAATIARIRALLHDVNLPLTALNGTRPATAEQIEASFAELVNGHSSTRTR